MALYDVDAPRKATNVTINSDLLRQVRETDVNLSALLEERLIALLRERREAQWRSENRRAIESYNNRVERGGVFGDGLRRF